MTGAKIALIGRGGFAKEESELLILNGCQVSASNSAEPGHFTHLHRWYNDELEGDKARFDGVALARRRFQSRCLKRRAAPIEWTRARGTLAPPVVSPKVVLAT